MKKKFLTLAICLTTLATTTIPAFASEVRATAGNSEVQIKTEATTMNITVPGDAALMVFKADGSNELPKNFNITNNSQIAGVHITDIKLSSAEWQLGNDTVNTKTLPKDEKTIKMEIGLAGTEKKVVPDSSAVKAKTGTATFGEADFVIPATETKTLNFKVERGAFTQASEAAKAFDMNINFAFN